MSLLDVRLSVGPVMQPLNAANMRVLNASAGHFPIETLIFGRQLFFIQSEYTNPMKILFSHGRRPGSWSGIIPFRSKVS